MAPPAPSSHLQRLWVACLALLLALAVSGLSSRRGDRSADLTPITPRALLVVGSANVDVTMGVPRMPEKGETMATDGGVATAVGGKGANQAVAAARMATYVPVAFIGQFGGDAHGARLRSALVDENVDVAASGRHAQHVPSGQGYVFLEPDGSATSVVVAGANAKWDARAVATAVKAAGTARVVMLQREVPEYVNEAVAAEAAKRGIPVVLDIGGEDRPVRHAHMRDVAYVCPNENELQRLTGLPTGTRAEVEAAARSLIEKDGARNVVATLSERGAVLVKADGAPPQWQEPAPVPGGVVVDATAAGDAFRAAFALSLAEGLPVTEGLRRAAAAGAIAVSRAGAEPSLPRRAEVDSLVAGTFDKGADATSDDKAPPPTEEQAEDSPLPLFASRLNSMKARADLDTSLEADALDRLVLRQAQVPDLGAIFFNYPEHLKPSTSAGKVRSLLKRANMTAGAVCVRFPEKDFRMTGALTSPDAEVRSAAVELCVAACEMASSIGARDVVVWPRWDGYNYLFSVDYASAFQHAVRGYREVSERCAKVGVRVSIEFKPTDEAARQSVIPTTGAALLLVREVGVDTFGLTLDFGHLLAAGENPAQSFALAAQAGKLFGVQLGDGHARGEDGLVFGSVNPRLALEAVYYLRRHRYGGIVYFDTFPWSEDPVLEASANTASFRRLWATSGALLAERSRFASAFARRDGLAALAALRARAP